MKRTYDIGNRRELFVDRLLIDRLQDTQLKLHEPVSGGVAIRIDKPWEGPGNGPISVLDLGGGRLHMYYRAMTLLPDDLSGVTCVAVSDDNGATWTKPALGLAERAGRRDTNLLADQDGQEVSLGPWLDTRPGVLAGERIKAITSEPVSGAKHTAFDDPIGAKRLVFWVSADGFTFRKLDPQPEMISDLPNCFDGGNTPFWSEAEQQYVVYYRFWDGEYRPNLIGYRSVARATSKDLMTWTPSVPMSYGDTPREQFYTNNTQPYFRAPHIYIAPAARFMERRRVVTVEQAEAIGVKMCQGHSYDNDCSDVALLTSRAGTAVYDRTFMETFVRPGPGYGNWVSRTNYPMAGILPAGDGHIQMFVARHYMQESWHVDRLLLRTDGFASVSAPWAGGEMVTKPFTFAGSRLEINYRTGAPGFVRVEIQDAAGQPVPGFTLEDCPEIIGDEISRIVSWKQGTDVAKLAGQPVRLRFVMKDSDLFALRFG